MSCAKGTVGAIKELAKWNANLDARDKLDRTPLQLAIRFGKLAAIDAMLDVGADVKDNAYALLKEAADLDVKFKPLDAISKLLKRGFMHSILLSYVTLTTALSYVTLSY